MATTDTNSVAFKNTWARGVVHVAQQKKSRFMQGFTVLRQAMVGEKHFIDKYGKRDPNQVVDRRGDSPDNPGDHQRRMITRTEWDDGETITRPDIFNTLDDPSNEVTMAFGGGFGRKIDNICSTALGGTAYEGKEGGTPIVLPSSQIVPVDYVPIGTPSDDKGLTVEKIIRAKELFVAADLDEDEELWMALGARQRSDLLNNTKATSRDYVDVMAMLSGKIDNLLGFKIINYQSLPFVTATNIRTVQCWAKSKVRLVLAKEPKAEIDPRRTDKKFNPYVYMMMSLGATRIEEEGVVEILCDEVPDS